MPRDTTNKRLRATMVDRSRSPRGREKGKDKTNARLLAAIAEEEKLDADDVAFRQTISDIYLRNKLSAKDTADLVRSANRSSCVGVGDLAKAGGGGKHPQKLPARSHQGLGAYVCYTNTVLRRNPFERQEVRQARYSMVACS